MKAVSSQPHTLNSTEISQLLILLTHFYIFRWYWHFLYHLMSIISPFLHHLLAPNTTIIIHLMNLCYDTCSEIEFGKQKWKNKPGGPIEWNIVIKTTKTRILVWIIARIMTRLHPSHTNNRRKATEAHQSSKWSKQ